MATAMTWNTAFRLTTPTTPSARSSWTTRVLLRPPARPRPSDNRSNVAPAPAPVATPTPPAATTTPPSTPEAVPPTPVAVAATGLLQLRILPWAEVTVDGRALGTTPLRPVGLEAGEHRVVLSHPSYKPLQKSVMIRADETTTLEVDLSYDAFPR